MLVESAAGLADRGFHVFPCLPSDKRPTVEDEAGFPGVGFAR
jgi:hypothetical protein